MRRATRLPQEARSIIADFLPARETQRVDRAGQLLTAHRLLDLRCEADCKPWQSRWDFEAGRLCLTWRGAQPLPGTAGTSRQGCLRVAQPLVVTAELRDLASRGHQDAQRWLGQVQRLVSRTPASEGPYGIQKSGWLNLAFRVGSPGNFQFDARDLLGRVGEEELLERWCRIAHARSSEAFAAYCAQDCSQLRDAALAKRTARRLVILFPRTLPRLPPELRSDKEVLEAALRQKGELLQDLPEELRDDRALVKAAVGGHGPALQHASTELRGDRGVVEAAVRQNGLALQHASEELRGDRAVVAAAVRQNGLALQHASAELRGDRGVVGAAVRNNGSALQHASTELRGDRAVAEAAVRRRGAAFEHASAELRSDSTFLQLAQRDRLTGHSARQHALGAARVDKALAMQELRQSHGDVFKGFAPELRGDEGVAKVAVMRDGHNYLHVLPPAKSKELLLHAVATEPGLFHHLDEAQRGDRDVALAALAANPRSFPEASDALRNDKAFALEAVRLHPENFQHAGPQARDDLETARLAVASNPRFFRIAGSTVRDDPALALAAVHAGVPLSFAGPAARNDPRIVLAALSRDSRALLDAGPDARNNKQVVLKATRGTSDPATRAAVGPAIRKDEDVAAALQMWGAR